MFGPVKTGTLAADGCCSTMRIPGEDGRAAKVYVGLDPNSNTANDISTSGGATQGLLNSFLLPLGVISGQLRMLNTNFAV